MKGKKERENNDLEILLLQATPILTGPPAESSLTDLLVRKPSSSSKHGTYGALAVFLVNAFAQVNMLVVGSSMS